MTHHDQSATARSRPSSAWPYTPRSSGVRIATVFVGAALYLLAHVLDLSRFDDSSLARQASDDYWSDSGELHHLISRAYLSVWGLGLVAMVVGIIVVLRHRRSTIVGVLCALCGLFYLVTVTTQAFIGPQVLVIAFGPVGALAVALASAVWLGGDG
jgi:hypothetical protein